jgi:hypothetical protein
VSVNGIRTKIYKTRFILENIEYRVRVRVRVQSTGLGLGFTGLPAKGRVGHFR